MRHKTRRVPLCSWPDRFQALVRELSSRDIPWIAIAALEQTFPYVVQSQLAVRRIHGESPEFPLPEMAKLVRSLIESNGSATGDGPEVPQ